MRTHLGVPFPETSTPTTSAPPDATTSVPPDIVPDSTNTTTTTTPISDPILVGDLPLWNLFFTLYLPPHLARSNSPPKMALSISLIKPEAILIPSTDPSPPSRILYSIGNLPQILLYMETCPQVRPSLISCGLPRTAW